MFEELMDFDCACGRHHRLETGIFRVGSGAIRELPDVLRQLGATKNPLAIYDQNTYEAAFGSVCSALPDADTLILDGFPVHPDEKQVDAIMESVPGHDVLLAVGSGVVCDLTRVCADKANLPFVAVPTAASVDGYVSGSSSMLIRGSKVTVPAAAPAAVVADIDIIRAAPPRLAASGVGDMLSKYISIADWKIGHLSNGEYYCEKIASLEKEAVDSIVDQIDGISRGEPKAMTALVRGLLLSGLAMQMAEITRPASSFEHHFSHYLETVPVGGEIDADALHGEKVGLATCYAAKYYPIFARSLSLIYEEDLPNRFSLERVKEMYSRFPRRVVEWVEKENTPTITKTLNKDLLRRNFDEIVDVADLIPSQEIMRDTLRKVGGMTSYEDIHMTRDEFRETMKICCYIRNRYTMLRLVCDYDLYDFDTMDD